MGRFLGAFLFLIVAGLANAKELGGKIGGREWQAKKVLAYKDFPARNFLTIYFLDNEIEVCGAPFDQIQVRNFATVNIPNFENVGDLEICRGQGAEWSNCFMMTIMTPSADNQNIINYLVDHGRLKYVVADDVISGELAGAYNSQPGFTLSGSFKAEVCPSGQSGSRATK